MIRKHGQWIAKWIVVLVFVFALKLFYSTANANELRWILAPTAACVELISGASFEFESYAGYINEDRTFLIANSCAGVNFLITAFLMLSAIRLLNTRSKGGGWAFIPATAAIAYLATIVANTTRIVLALGLRNASEADRWLAPDQLHRLEGILIYFSFLLILFELSERPRSDNPSTRLRWSLLPLGVYYATMLGIPLANNAYRQGRDFWEYSIFVLLIPSVLMSLIVLSRYCHQRLSEKLGGH